MRIRHRSVILILPYKYNIYQMSCVFFYLTYSAGFDRQLDSTHMNRSAEEVSSIFIFFFRI